MTEPLMFESAVSQILERVPELESDSRYLMMLENEGTPIQRYTLMWVAERLTYDLCRALQQEAERFQQAEDTLRRILALVEEGLRSDDQNLRDLMGTGFLEIMDPDDPCFATLKAHMGPLTQAEVATTFGPGWHRTRPRPPSAS